MLEILTPQLLLVILVLGIVIPLAAIHTVRVWFKPGSPLEEVREYLELFSHARSGRWVWLKVKLGTLAGCSFCLLTQLCLWSWIGLSLLLWLGWMPPFFGVLVLLLGLASAAVADFLFRRLS